jgi:hypothetical protein
MKALLLLIFCALFLTACQEQYNCVIKNNLTFSSTIDVAPAETLVFIDAPYTIKILNYGFTGHSYYTEMYTSKSPSEIKYSFITKDFGNNYDILHVFYFNESGISGRYADNRLVNLTSYTMNWSCLQ